MVLAYIAKNPKATAREIAEACSVKLHTVYNITYTARKNAMRKLIPDMVPVPKVKDIVQTHHTDNVNHPAHYKVGGIETIDFIEAKQLGYNLGNVIKYITRAEHKGNTHEDLCKARWYLNREIAKGAK